jgi:hypothetical protein
MQVEDDDGPFHRCLGTEYLSHQSRHALWRLLTNLVGRMQAHCQLGPCAIDLVLGASVQPKLDSGEGSSDSGKRYHGYWVDGQVAGRGAVGLDGQSQDRDLVGAVDHLEEACRSC